MTTVPPRVADARVRRIDVTVHETPVVPQQLAPAVLVVPDVVPVQHDPIARRLRELESEVAVLRDRLAVPRTG